MYEYITNWAEIRELEMGAEDLGNIATRRAVRQVDGEAEALRNDNDFARWYQHLSAFGCDQQLWT